MKLPADLRGERLDRAISTGLHRVGRPVSVREVRLALRAGRIRVDGQRRAPGLRAQGGEAVDVETFAARHEARIEGQPELLERVTVLETWPDLWALDKPTGLPCAPLRAEERDTLLHAAVALDPEVAQAGPPLEGGLCHRLDTGTSGAVLFARRTEARDRVRAWFGQHAVEKTYLARVASGAAEALPARVDRPIGPGPQPDRVRVYAYGEALPAESHLRLLAQDQDSGWVEVRTRYGRRHQVRAHLAHAGAPIDGDALYGGREGPRLMLHAASLHLPDGRRVDAPVPSAFALPAVNP